MADRTAKWILWLAVLGLVLLQGCREEEQDRPLLYDKGTYLGAPEPQLDAERVDELRFRARNQRF